MKIGFDAKRYFNNSTGLGNYSRWLIDALPKKEVTFTLYQPKKAKYNGDLPISYPQGIFRFFTSLWRTTFICNQLVAEEQEIYHGLSNELPFGIHKTSLKTVVTIHDLINLRYPNNYAIIDRLVFKIKLKYAQKCADKIVVPSEQTKNDLIHFYKTDEQKIAVIPLSLPKLALGQKKDLEVPYILCVSGFSKRKNLDNLVRAYGQITGNCRLILAGNKGDTTALVTELAQADTRIEIKHNVSSTELADLYTNALFCVYPSVFEGFGLPILEAFNYGKAVATSAASSMPEVGGDVAVYFDPLRIGSIAEQLLYLLDEKNRSEKELLITEHLKHFDTNHLIGQYIKMYKSLVTK
jgi:glycosyltransferase involved in cell wall biosynthesis